MAGKRRASQAHRTADYIQRKAVQKLSGSKPDWCSPPFLENYEWHYLWYSTDAMLKLMLATSLNVLFALLNTWRPDTTNPHSSPFYALLWFQNLYIDRDHHRRLKNYATRLSIETANQSEAIRTQNELYYLDILEKGKRLQYKLVTTHLHTHQWAAPTGENDHHWSHYKEWKTLIAAECFGVNQKKLCSDLWPTFVEASKMAPGTVCNLLQVRDYQ
jgi:hypothetical protein